MTRHRRPGTATGYFPRTVRGPGKGCGARTPWRRTPIPGLVIGALAAAVLGGYGAPATEPERDAAPGAFAGSADSATARIVLVVLGGRLQGAPPRLRILQNSRVSLVVSSDVAGTVTAEGQDAEIELVAGDTVALRFVAESPGVSEVRLEDEGILLAQLEVSEQ